MNPEQRLSYPIAEIFPDGRKPIHELYDTYFQLLESGWTIACIALQKEKNSDGAPLSLPIYAFLSPIQKQEEPVPSLWILGGIHGEEPAPAHAFAQEIETIQALHTQGIPVVAIPIANPGGYCNDRRYIDKKRRPLIGKQGKSVGDAEHLLPHHTHAGRSRKPHPSSRIADALTSWILTTSNQYYPQLVLNHHEDELDLLHVHHDSKYYYNYVYGNPLVLEQITPTIKNILEQNGQTLQKKGRTRHDNVIINGFVHNVQDSSLDELFAASTYILNGHVRHKEPSLAVITIETLFDPKKPETIEKRASTHRKIIQHYSSFWKKIQDFS